MKDRLEAFLKHHGKDGISGRIASSVIHIRDCKEEQGGDIEISEKDDPVIKSLVLYNEANIAVYHCAFADNSFCKEVYNTDGELIAMLPGEQYRQCECILFPFDYDDKKEQWTLLVETKYAHDMTAASKKSANYPQHMIEQVIHTAAYLRRHGIVPNEKQLTAILSFPKVLADFSATLFQGDVFEENEAAIDIRKAQTSNKLNLTQIQLKYKIVIRAVNSAVIRSEKRLITTKP